MEPTLKKRMQDQKNILKKKDASHEYSTSKKLNYINFPHASSIYNQWQYNSTTLPSFKTRKTSLQRHAMQTRAMTGNLLQKGKVNMQ